METRASYVLIGGFVVSVLALVFVAVIWLGRSEFHREKNYYDIYFSGSVTGLNTGAPVRYNGVQIGRVEEIQIDPANIERVRVTIQVDRPDVIREGAVASLELQGITGYAFVQITGGSKDSPRLQRSGSARYPVIAAIPSRLEKVFQSAPALLERTINVADRLADILNDKNREAIAETLENLRTTTQALGGTGGQIDGMLVEGAKAVKELRETLARVNGLTANLDSALNSKDGAVTRLNATMEQAEVTVRKVGDIADRLDTIVQENRPAIRDFSQRTLTDLQQLISETRSLVGGLSRVTAEIERDPPRFFFGDRREGYRPR
jgi:phospholipid/cholesterol/gamma-HCH transport system substrate-binding protein